jgi:hypothetical protein
MLDVTTALDLTIFTYSLLIGVGNVIKAFIVLFAAGPLIERVGPRQACLATTVAMTVLLAAASIVPNRATFCAAIILLVAATSLCELPTVVCLLATHFDNLLSFATSSASSAFSLAGALLPLTLSPLLVTHGWRVVFATVAGGCALLIPMLHVHLQPGSLSVGRTTDAPDAHAGGAPTATNPRSCALSREQIGWSADGAHPPPQTVTASSVGSGGMSAKEVFRSVTFHALWAATFLHIFYGALLAAHMTTLLRLAGLDVMRASAVSSIQFTCALVGKIASGALLSLTTPAATRLRPSLGRPIRLLLFVATPAAYVASHLLLVDIDLHRLAAAASGTGTGGGLCATFRSSLVFVTSAARLVPFAAVVGSSFGLLFGLLQCLPARLFGRRDLATIQSANFAAILFGASIFGPLVGFLRDACGGYQVPLLVTFLASTLQMALMVLLMRADAKACLAPVKYSTLAEEVM